MGDCIATIENEPNILVKLSGQIHIQEDPFTIQ